MVVVVVVVPRGGGSEAGASNLVVTIELRMRHPIAPRRGRAAADCDWIGRAGVPHSSAAVDQFPVVPGECTHAKAPRLFQGRKHSRKVSKIVKQAWKALNRVMRENPFGVVMSEGFRALD